MGDRSDYDNPLFNESSLTEDCVVYINCDVSRIPNYLFFNGVSYSSSGDSSRYSRLSQVIFEEGSVCSYIGKSAFASCVYLQSINLPESITYISNSAFNYCRSLTSINLSDNLTTISDYAFDGCIKLESIYLGENLTKVYNYAFRSCISIKNVYYDAKNLTVFEYVTNTNEYNYTFLGVHAENLFFGKNVESLPCGLFSYNNNRHISSSFDNVVFEEGCKLASIGYCAFDGCEIGKVTIDEECIYNLVGYFINKYVSQVCVKINLFDASPKSDLDDTNNYSKAIEGDYYVFTRIVAD